MALSRGTANASVFLGFIILTLAFGCIAAGAFAMSKFNAWLLSTGLWAIYFLIPAIALLVAGFGRYIAMLAVSIGANVLGILVAIAGITYSAAVWVALNQDACLTFGDVCICISAVSVNSESVLFTSCSDVESVRYASAAATILYVFLLILSFVGSIIGCAGACCGNRGHRHRYGMASQPYVIPYGNPNTMMMTRIQERRTFDNDPYLKQARYIHDRPYHQEPPYYRNEPYTKALPYPKREPYTEESPYVDVERQYHRGYLQEYPSHVPPRSLPAREGHNFFAGHANESFDGRNLFAGHYD